MVNFSPQIPDCDSCSPVFLHLFPSFDTSICSMVADPPFANSDHVFLVFIDFPANSKWDAPFNGRAFDYSWVNWNGVSDHIRNTTWEYIFDLDASTAVFSI